MWDATLADNAGHCLIVKVEDVVIGGSDPTNGDGANTNIRAYKLCEPLGPRLVQPVHGPSSLGNLLRGARMGTEEIGNHEGE